MEMGRRVRHEEAEARVAYVLLLRRYWVWAAAAALALGAGWIGFKAGQSRPVARDPLPIGETAPTFRLQETDGQVIRLRRYVGRPVVLNFWAAWCPYCRSETSLLIQAAHRYRNRVVVLGVDVEDPRPLAAQYLRRSHIPYPVLLDRSGRVALHYDVQELPTTVFINARGRIAAVKVGPFTRPRELDRSIRALLRTVPVRHVAPLPVRIRRAQSGMT